MSGKTVLETLKQKNISADSILTFDNLHTPTKTRVTTKHQQLIRMDRELPFELNASQESGLLKEVKKHEPSCIIISDYAKGTLSKTLIKSIIDYGKTIKAFTIIDPKDKNFAHYQGSSLITPNLKEAKIAAGLSDEALISSNQLCEKLVSTYKFDSLLLTLGSEGMLFYQKNKNPFHVKPVAQEVYDVSGAGDTVVAAFAFAFSNGEDFQRSVEFANRAAAISVSKWGTYAVSLDDILSQNTRKKIYPAADLAKITEQKNLTVFTNGCFDLLHRGHLEYLKEARDLGDKLIVAVNSDASVKRLKGEKRPINSLEDRMEMLAALEFVDYVTWFEEDTPLKTIEQIKPNILVKGGDWKPDQIVGSDVVLENGGKVLSLTFKDGYSSTFIIDSIVSSHSKS